MPKYAIRRMYAVVPSHIDVLRKRFSTEKAAKSKSGGTGAYMSFDDVVKVERGRVYYKQGKKWTFWRKLRLKEVI